MKKVCYQSRLLIFILILASLLASILVTMPVHADMAPPENPPGFNPEPGTQVTQVRMVEETVIIDVQAVEPVKAHVTANFVMKNLGEQTENMWARFPVAASDGYGWFPELENFGVKVNNQPVEFERYETEFRDEEFNISSWAHFPISFPPGEIVNVKVSYDLTSTYFYYQSDPAVSFSYILSTGAGWKDSIGSATIILRLPYEANQLNILVEEMRRKPDKIQGREAHWIFNDLEPELEDNLFFPIVKPKIWGQVETMIQKVHTNPNDGEAWGMLAKAYKESLIFAKGYCRSGDAAQLFYLSSEAYEKAITLKPDDALWHAGFADLLVHGGVMDCQGDNADRELALVELQRALELAPNDLKVLEIYDEFSWYLPDRLIQQTDGTYILVTPSATFEALTNTSTSTPMPLSATQKPAEMVNPTDFPTVTSTIPAENNQPEVPNPICGGGIFVLFLPVIAGLWKFLRK